MNSVEKWGNEWDYYAGSKGYEDGYSIFALRWFLLVLFDEESFNEATEKRGTRAYNRSYYNRNRERRREQCRKNVERFAAKLGMTVSEYMKKYREENRGRIAVLGMRSRERIKERERLRKARGEE